MLKSIFYLRFLTRDIRVSSEKQLQHFIKVAWSYNDEVISIVQVILNWIGAFESFYNPSMVTTVLADTV